MPDPVKITEESTLQAGFPPPRPGDVPRLAGLADLASDHLPGFTLIEKLGQGGMGVVFKARQTMPSRIVALKMILHGAYASEQVRLRFQREAEAVARVQHPNITQIFEYGEAEGRPFFAMEFLEGGTLDAKLRAQAIPPMEASRIIETLARAIHVAHQQKIVHRDLKPSNILLTLDGVPKISDFGLAKWIDDEHQLTPTDAKLGTISYMAPEQADGGRGTVGPAADVYGLGAILYQMLTGRAPFLGESTLDTLLRVMRDDPLPPHRVQSQVPADLEAICLKCLEKKPTSRYAGAADLADDLARFQRREPTLARPVGAFGRAIRWCRRHPAHSSVILVTLVAILSVIGILIWSNRQLDERRKETETRLAENYFERGLSLCEKRDAGLGLHYMIRALETLPPERIEIAEALRFNIAAWSESLHRLEHVVPHGQPVQDLRCFKDGKQFVTAGHDGVVRIIDLRTGEIVHQLKHAKTVWSVGVSPDGTLVGSASEDGTAKIWNRGTGEEVHSLPHPKHVLGISFHPSGRWAGTSCIDGITRVWNLENGKLASSLAADGEPLAGIGFSKDGHWLVASGMKRDVHLWDLRTEPPTGPIRVEHAITGPLGNPTAVMSLALSPDGRFLLTGANGAIQIWNLTTNTRVALCEHAGNIRGIAVHPEGKFFVSASEGKSHCVWNLEGKLLAGPIIHDAFVYRARFHPSGRWFVTATIHGDVQAWSSDTLRPVGSEIHHAGGINSLDFSPDGKSLLVAMNSGLAYVWSMNFEATNLLWQMPAPTGLTQVQLHAEKDLFAVSANDGTIRLGDANTGRWLPRVYSHGRDAKLIFSMFRHSPRIAMRVIVNPLLEKSDLAIFWNYETGETFESKPFPCDSLGFSLSPDDRHLVVWSGDRLWIEEIAAGKRDGPISLPGGVTGDSIAFPDKQTMLIALATGRVVELGIGENVVKDAALPHPGGVNNVSLSRSRQWLATHCADQHVRRWDLPSRRLLPPVIANIEGPIEFDRRDRLLVTSGDGLRIFDPFTGRLLGPMLHDDHPPLRWFSVSKTQDAVLAISDHSIRMWRLPIMASAPLPELRDGIERSTGLSLTPEGEVRKIDEKAWSERINRKAMR